MGILKTIGSWLYSLASSLGGPGLMFIAIADSSFVSIPEGSDLLIVVLSIGKSWQQMSYYTLMTVIGSVIGCHLLFFSGRLGGRAILEKRFPRDKIRRAETFIRKYGIWSVLIPSLLPPPMPFKIFVLTAGVFRMNPWRFCSAVLLGRSIRYFMWGILAVLYGDHVRVFMVENIKTIGLALMIALTLTVAGLWGHHFRSRRKRSPVEVAADAVSPQPSVQ